MSGSPVFIDGKLLGAVAFSFAFSKEAVGGITPITQMIDAFTEGDPSGQVGAADHPEAELLWDYQLRLRNGAAHFPMGLPEFPGQDGASLIPKLLKPEQSRSPPRSCPAVTR